MEDYYDTLADELVERYESLQFEAVHRKVLDEFPGVAAQILDVGAGSGRDAAALASQGHHVVAVEPSDELRQRAKRRHSNSNILWKSDRLPSLSKIYDIGDTYDLILLSAVWMHIPPEDRDRAMRKLVGLLEPGGKLVITSRTVPFDGRRTLHEVKPDRLTARGEDHGLTVRQRSESTDLLGREDVDWATVVFEAPDDGTAALPVLRNIIVNDDKFSTYKLGLLRTLLRIAAEAGGLVSRHENGTIRIPMGLVCLYWLRSYWEPVRRGIQQMNHGQPAFTDNLLALNNYLSQYDLRFGRTFSGTVAQRLHGTLKRIRKSLTSQGPVVKTTYVDTDQQIFLHHNARTPGAERVGDVELSPDYLESFGWLSIPGQIFDAMTRHWVWIEPTILREWTSMVRKLEGPNQRSIEEHERALLWRGEDPRETDLAAQRLLRFAETGASVARGVWSGHRLHERSDFEVDHCIPYAHWHNNSLWNLLPATRDANQAKSDRLPAADLLTSSRERITHWWNKAWLHSEQHRRFVFEADASLPGTDLALDNCDLDDIFHALEWQVSRMRRDQQIKEWPGLE